MRPYGRGKAGTVTGQTPVRRRLVGAALRRYRENVGYTLDDAARVLDCDRSKISRVETGQRGIRPKELRELLAEYGVPDGEQDALAVIAGRGGPRGWPDSYPDVLSGKYGEALEMAETGSDAVSMIKDNSPPVSPHEIRELNYRFCGCNDRLPI